MRCWRNDGAAGGVIRQSQPDTGNKDTEGMHPGGREKKRGFHLLSKEKWIHSRKKFER